MRIITRPRIAIVVALAVIMAPVAAYADTGVQGGSYVGTTAPTGEKPQSKLWYHEGSWWAVLFNPVSTDFEIYRYNRDTWSWSSTDVPVDTRSTARVDALVDGSTLHTISAVRTAAVVDQRVLYQTFSYNGTEFTPTGSSISIHSGALEEVVLTKDSTGVLWANWTDDGKVYVTHSYGGSWVTPYRLAEGLVSGNPDGDSSSIIAFDGKIGVMWSNQITGSPLCDPLLASKTCEGFHFAVHVDGANDDPALDWTHEPALLADPITNPKPADDHMNLKALPSGEVLAAVKHSNTASGSLPEVSVLRRTTAGVWESPRTVWTHNANITRPIIEVDTGGTVHVFGSAPCCSGGKIYRKQAPLSSLSPFTPSTPSPNLGETFISLSSDVAVNNPTSTKQSVNSSTGLLVMAGDDVNDRYAFNYLTLGGATIVPSWPSALNGTPGNASVTLTWAAPGNDGNTSDGANTVTQYEVYLNGAVIPHQQFSGNVTSGLVTGLTNGIAYTFTVKAKNSAGLGPASPPSAPVTPYTVPDAPTAVVAVPGDNSATVAWVPPLNNGGSAITGYTVTSSPGGATTSVGATATSATVTGLNNGTSYTFTVKATNLAGASLGATSNAVVPRTLAGSPLNVTAVPGDASATVSWTAPANTGGLPILGYVVTPSLNGLPLSAINTSAATTQTITGLTNGATYTFMVKATTLAGNGAASVASNPVTPRTVPGAPTSVTAAGGDGLATVTWAGPADNGGSAITGYVVTASPGGKSVSVGAAANSATLTGLENLVTYTFNVSAINAAGTGPGSSSSPVRLHSAGYWMVGADGAVYAFGDAADYGQPVGALGSTAAVDLEPAPSGQGYWIVESSGRVFAYNAPHFGNVDASKLRTNEKVTSLSATPAGDGYWIFTSRGRVFQFGNAKWYDDLHDVSLNGPILDTIVTPSGRGYYMVGSDGGVFAFGDAVFYGSMGSVRLNAPVQSLVPDPDSTGYWLVASDGGVFAFQAGFRGSMGGLPLNRPVTGMVPYGNGYLMVAEDGGIFNFSNMAFRGSLGGSPPAGPIVSVAVLV